MHWRLGADLGTNSLGWAVVRLNEHGEADGIEAAGSRIFSDGREPKSGASLAGGRRDARAMRRRRDRFKQRQAALLKDLTLAGLVPVDEAQREALAALDPYELRGRALDGKLPLAHLGRALFHLNQRRGFKSNRKTDRAKDDDQGKIRVGVARLHAQMDEAGARTLGEFLHKRRAEAKNPSAIPHVRTRVVTPEADDGKAAEIYDFYPDRQTLEEEFEAIWAAQAAHHPEALTPERRAQFYEIIFHQRPLKEPRIGYCTLLPPEPRLPKAHPLFQRRRLLEEVNALRIVRAGAEAQPLDKPQRDALLSKLAGKKAVAYASLRSRGLKLDPDDRFNKESENRKEMKGDEVAAELSHASRFGKPWLGMSADTQWEVVARLRALESDAEVEAFEAWLRERHALSAEQARAVTGARLPEGYGRFGETATRKLIVELEKDVVVYSVAVERAGLGHHSDFRDGSVWVDAKGRPALPYYGQILERHILPGTADPEETDEALKIGRLTNPTVHIGLNQLRRVLNALIRRYGPPAEIAIELARELKLDEERKKELNRINRDNREAAERRSKTLREDLNQDDKGGNRAILKLWEELNRDNVLDRRCVYSGRQISAAMLFSGAVEIDHILPFSQTLDDSNGNRILCLREVNRLKRRRTPHEAAGDLRAHFGPDADWEAIAARAARLPREKRWRFEPDAMAKFNEKGGFLARHLTDTQHLSRLAREYLSALYPHTGESSSHVWVSPGRLTEMLRRTWSLNHHLPDHNLSGGANQPKNRRDHRHHAIDAIVVAVTDRSMLQRISREAGRQGLEAANRIAEAIPDPWDGFSDEVGRVVRAITVSHRPDHGSAGRKARDGRDTTAGRLHNETAYGLTGEKDARGLDIVVTRKPLSSFKKASDLDAIRDENLKQKLKDWTSGKEGAAFEQAMRSFGDRERGPRTYPGLRRIRVTEPLSVIAIRDREGRPYKAYKGDSNSRFDVWQLKDGKWKDEVVSMFSAHQSGWTSPIRAENPTARKVLSLRQNDVVAVERDGDARALMRIVKFSSGSLVLAPPQEAGSLKARDADKEDPFKYVYGSPSALLRWKARQVRIDETGRVFDPGFPARKPRGRG